MTTTGVDGKSYVMTVCDLDTLPGWLFSIGARKVEEEVREKLVRYQREAAKVLADHFLRGSRPAAVDPIRSALTSATTTLGCSNASEAGQPISPPAGTDGRGAAGEDFRNCEKTVCQLLDAV